PREATDSAIIAISPLLLPPNDLPAKEAYMDRTPTREAYMDRTPATMVGRMRADITASARTLLRNGHRKEALKLALFMHQTFGNNPYTFPSVRMADSVFITEKEFASLFLELADSLHENELASFLIKASGPLPENGTTTPAQIGITDSVGKSYLRGIGATYLKEADARKKAWMRYKRTLSPSMRLNMSKTP
ncbi:MAG: hypothetical protein K2J87_01065, partial [Muribaculaceae bacterium]|nr:hypothetical protein [Muribaculaceae bacterium]